MMYHLGVPAGALVVPVPAVEGVVGRHRRRLDPSARDGMAAHITVLYPFAPASEVDESLVVRLTEVFGSIAPFDFSLVEIGWFNSRVAYLAPAPDVWFREMTAAAAASFPRYPPYEGNFADIVPHLTIGEGAHPLRLRRAARRVRRRLPVLARAVEVQLMTIDDDSTRWTCAHVFALGDTEVNGRPAGPDAEVVRREAASELPVVGRLPTPRRLEGGRGDRP